MISLSEVLLLATCLAALIIVYEIQNRPDPGFKTRNTALHLKANGPNVAIAVDGQVIHFAEADTATTWINIDGLCDSTVISVAYGSNQEDHE